ICFPGSPRKSRPGASPGGCGDRGPSAGRCRSRDRGSPTDCREPWFEFRISGSWSPVSLEKILGAADSGPQPPRMSFRVGLGRLLDRNRAAALALAGVLARAAGVAGLAAPLALARVHSLAGVLHVGRGAPALA